MHEDFEKASRILRELFRYFLAHPEALEQHGGRRRQEDPLEVSVADFIAGNDRPVCHESLPATVSPAALEGLLTWHNFSVFLFQKA